MSLYGVILETILRIFLDNPSFVEKKRHENFVKISYRNKCERSRPGPLIKHNVKKQKSPKG